MSERRDSSALGAHYDGDGVRFAVRAPGADAVELCIVSPDEWCEERRITLATTDGELYHGRVAGLAPGALYAYRVHGPYAPRRGARFNPAKRLVDPYARAIAGPLAWRDDLCGYDRDEGPDSERPDPVDSADMVPPAVVVDERFDWGADAPPRTPLSDTVVYECHVKGLTVAHTEVAREARGRYLGVASEPVLSHLAALGVTAVELLPVQHKLDERHLVERALTNYWGYNPICWTAPDARFASAYDGAQVTELKETIKRLHAAGIEVLLDVVFNHSGEGDHRGPTVSLKGFGNAAYYDLEPERLDRYRDFSGCGATLRMQHPLVRELILESLRRWVLEYHVDGFRFDLAAALAREDGRITPDLGVLSAIAADPVLASVKLIAEPWDAAGGSVVGRLPAPWLEWNGEYRDAIRRAWRKGREPHSVIGPLASGLAGSSDIYARSERGPCASVNFAASHDGPTLADLTSYARKHNEVNGEDNCDGPAESFASNWGEEGPTTDAKIARARDRARRNVIATVALSLGVPMLQHGDELGRTQLGLDNGYCQDTDRTWMDWTSTLERAELLAFVRSAFAVRRSYTTFRRTTHFTGEANADGGRDLAWYRPDGGEMTAENWGSSTTRAVAALYDGRRVGDGWLLLLLNTGAERCAFSLPAKRRWELRLATGVVETSGERSAAIEEQSLALFHAAEAS